LIVDCACCHHRCRHLFIAAAAIFTITVVNAAAIATAIAAAITAVVAVTNAIVAVILVISTAITTDDNSNGGIVTWLGWLWIVA
jgi:hypothetical protein